MNKNIRIRYHNVRALRDLSRCPSFNGFKVKKGVFFRSGHLGKLSDLEFKKFAERFNIGYVIDLRTEAEVQNAPDPKMDIVEYFHIPLLQEFDNPLITKENRTEILLDISKNKGGAVKYLSRIYTKMVSDEYCLGQFKKIFNIIFNKKTDKAIVFHCTQGKDRTGLLAALILFGLGFDRDTICRDYIRFNNGYKIKNITIACLIAIIFFSCKVAKDLYYLLMGHKKLIKATFDAIYGESADCYEFFNNKLGINKTDIDKFREIYLVKEE